MRRRQAQAETGQRFPPVGPGEPPQSIGCVRELLAAVHQGLVPCWLVEMGQLGDEAPKTAHVGAMLTPVGRPELKHVVQWHPPRRG
jgi:hypothetical protein